MNFEDTPHEAEFRREAHAFLSRHWSLRLPGMFAPPYVNIDDKEVVDAAKAWQACKYENGWACLEWPEAIGGRGASPIEAVIFEQEERRFDTPSTTLFMIGHGMLGPTIMAHGTERQKHRYLTPMARGEHIWCQLFSEPSGGSDLAAVRTAAVREGDDWILNGQKIWTSAAHIGRYAVCVTRTNKSVAKHKGITCFIVDLHKPGIDIRPIRQMDGSADFNEVFLENVRIPDEDRLGEIDGGWAVVLTCLTNERVTLSGGLWTLGIKDLMSLARDINIDGKSAVKDNWVANRIADLHIRMKGVERIELRSITALSQGRMPGPEASISKLLLGKLGQDIASLAIDLEGMSGMVHTPKLDFQLAYLRSPSLRLAGGTDEILRNIIAERVLKMPR